MNMLPRIAERVLGRPLLIHVLKAELILALLGERIGVGSIELDDVPEEFKAARASKPAANRLIGEPVMRGRQVAYMRAGGVGIIPVVGTLVNRGAFMGEDGSGFTSYEGLSAQLEMALADREVGAILLDIDSPGGEASGAFTLAASVREARMHKPITALVNDMAASAAYGIASNATDIVVSPSSVTGSIGVVLMHVDQSKELEMKGRKPTLIFAGAHKVDGNSLGPISDQVRADMQTEVNTYYDRFLETVAAGRPKLTIDAIRQTEARTYIGADAISVGLADRIGTFGDTVGRLSAAVRAHTLQGGRWTMTNPTPPVMNLDPTMITRVEHDALLAAARTAAVAEGHAAGEKTGAIAALARVSAILALPEAKERQAQALVIALTTELSVQQSAGLLASTPIVAAATPTPKLEDRGNPPVPGTVPAPATVANLWNEVHAENNRNLGFAPRQHVSSR
jgi:capsid assembly protease